MGLLAHTQAEFPRLIQISDLAGGYTLSFVIMLAAACIAQMLPQGNGVGSLWRAHADRENQAHSAKDSRPLRVIAWWPLAAATAVIGATLLYGQWRLSERPPGLSGPTARVALIQGSLDTVFDTSTEQLREIFAHFQSLTDQAVARHPNLDLIAWPESAFVVGETLIEEPMRPSSNDEPSKDELQSRQAFFHTVLAGEAARANSHTELNGRTTQLLVGALTYVYGPGVPRTYNAALLADRSGNVINRYYKMHPVMFGEYIPFGAALPWLYKITPMAAGLSCGSEPAVFDVAGLKMSPSVCFESTIPHLIRGQLRQLARRGTPADVLINVTNDGWFWGTGILDLHFRCGVFRAVENRKPLLVVANTGISTWVDGSGVIRQRESRRQRQVLVAEVQADGRTSPHAIVGDWPAWLCAIGCIGLAIAGLSRRKEP
jgi:apolipoprotein N-acyltransferase